MTEKSYSKINLLLYNLGKRKDGYHELYTLFYQIDLYDTITIEQAGETVLYCDTPEVPTDNRNIILKVDNILRSNYGLKDKFKITLHKEIPTGGGLGGGSGNAATYLKMVNNYSNLNLSVEVMHKILSGIGSDTAFFLYPPAAIGRGRGELLTPLESFPKLNILIVNPGIPVPTGGIFASRNLLLTTLDNRNMIPDSLDMDIILGLMKNDLEAAVFADYPEVKNVSDAISASGALKALMSGSGSTVFGIYDSKEKLNNAYQLLKNKYKNYLVKIV